MLRCHSLRKAQHPTAHPLKAPGSYPALFILCKQATGVYLFLESL